MHSLSPLPEVSSEKIDFKIVKDYGGGKKPRYPLVVSHGKTCLLTMNIKRCHVLHLETNVNLRAHGLQLENVICNCFEYK